MISPRTSIIPIEHVRILTDTPFATVVERLRAETGIFDLTDFQRRLTAGEPPKLVVDAIAGMAGSSGFMRFLEADHGSSTSAPYVTTS